LGLYYSPPAVLANDRVPTLGFSVKRERIEKGPAKNCRPSAPRLSQPAGRHRPASPVEARRHQDSPLLRSAEAKKGAPRTGLACTSPRGVLFVHVVSYRQRHAGFIGFTDRCVKRFFGKIMSWLCLAGSKQRTGHRSCPPVLFLIVPQMWCALIKNLRYISWCAMALQETVVLLRISACHDVCGM
jgi:hypothetical protein